MNELRELNITLKALIALKPKLLDQKIISYKEYENIRTTCFELIDKE